MVSVYVPSGMKRVVATVRVTIAPVEEGVMVEAERLMEPHGLAPELTWQTAGSGEIESMRVTDSAAPLVRVTVTVADVEEPPKIDVVVGDRDNV